MKTSKQSLFLAGITVLFLSGMSVQAQENDELPRLDAMDEITVTARKREESLKDIPVTIDVLSSDMIDEAGILDMYDFFGLVAGIDMEDPNGDRNGANPAIRGVQSGGTRQHAEWRRKDRCLLSVARITQRTSITGSRSRGRPPLSFSLNMENRKC